LARLQIRLFGSYRVTLDETPLEGFDSDKSRLLLAYLSVNAGKPERREHLAGLFWPEQSEAHARRNLSQALYNLRQLLNDHDGNGEHEKTGKHSPADQFLISDAQTIQFNPASSYHLDTQRFLELLSTCQYHHHRYMEACPDCMMRLSEVNALYQGDFLESISLKDSSLFEEWRLMQSERFNHEALEALHKLASCHEYRGDLKDAVRFAERQVEIDPLWEPGQQQLVYLLAVDGQNNQALAHYESYKNHLFQELAATPDKSIQALVTRLQLEAQDGISKSRLPPATSPLIGRKDELAELHCYLRDPACRLLTIIGPGGCGKTRLALEAAWAVQNSFPDGAFLISLSALTSSQSLFPVIAETLGFVFREQGDPHQQLLDYLSPKALLLVLDSFEAV
jgi:DNA-binding SARP family transcriptional activator